MAIAPTAMMLSTISGTGPTRLARVELVESGTFATRAAGTNRSVCEVTAPSGAMMALTPLVAATTDGAAVLDCPHTRHCQLLIGHLGVPESGVVGRYRQQLCTVAHRFLERPVERHLVTSRDTDGYPRCMDNAVALAWNEIARAIGVRGEVPEEASVGQVFAERLNDLLVVLFLRTVGAVPHDHRIGGPYDRHSRVRCRQESALRSLRRPG